MYKLMKLELRRNNLNTYMKISMIGCLFLIGFIYFVAVVAQVENEPDFQKYSNIFLFTSIMSMFFFSILSATMFSRFVIEEYKGKKMILLFSYPVNRKKILLSKIAVVVVFSTASMIISNIPPIVIFSITETFSPIVNDTLSSELLFSVIKTIIILSIGMNGISLIAMRIGFINKSVPSTIVSALLLCALFGNAVIGSFEKSTLSLILLAISTAAGIIATMNLMGKINRIEVE
ncbi:ABC transporter permease [Lysinibacillus sp. G4S2]|uniref:ABC transporter permease n=1 Tax=Lysinibacillus sp. G4S2 TaxID=3055859 RepID=UPI0025A16E75|nr:ABC transporter permease [Lysinibacillus sp. G4S2]MDM5249184.1 ABC transporter permease [Lysinibacillus sp. G4S2]